MTENAKTLVSFHQFIVLMNQELRNHPRYLEGVRFINVGTGYDLVFPDSAQEGPSASASLAKEIFDKVSSRYTIAR